MLIDVAITGDRNVTKKEAEKILKYKDLITKIQGMWNMKATVIPLIIGAIGTISKSLRKYLSNIPGEHEIKELQKKKKNSHFRHCTHTPREVLTLKFKTHFTGEITLHVAQIVNTEQLQHCIPKKHGLFQVNSCKYPA